MAAAVAAAAVATATVATATVAAAAEVAAAARATTEVAEPAVPPSDMGAARVAAPTAPCMSRIRRDVDTPAEVAHAS